MLFVECVEKTALVAEAGGGQAAVLLEAGEDVVFNKLGVHGFSGWGLGGGLLRGGFKIVVGNMEVKAGKLCLNNALEGGCDVLI